MGEHLVEDLGEWTLRGRRLRDKVDGSRSRREVGRSISIFGANGATGRILVDEALKRGHGVNAVTRHPPQFPLKHERLHIARVILDDLETGADFRKPVAVTSR